jgi:putative flippase GtrA
MRKIGLSWKMRLRDMQPRSIQQFFRYCVIGSISTVIDIGGLFLLVEFAHFQVIPAAIVSFSVSVINGFVFNRNWTFNSSGFRDSSGGRWACCRGWVASKCIVYVFLR